MSDLDDLASARAELNDLAVVGGQSVRYFFDPAQQVFAVTADERVRGVDPDPEDRPIRRITTTVTCLESIIEGPPRNWNVDDQLWATARLQEFTTTALKHREHWRSENAAKVYCRVRALGSMLRLQPSIGSTSATSARVKALLGEAWASRDDKGGSVGLREATEDDVASWTGEAKERTYPPNAYLTYWGLLANAGCDGEAQIAAQLSQAARDWLTRELGVQIGLASVHSRLADPQQLAWSLCGLVRFSGSTLLKTNSMEWELLRAGLAAFFAQQDDRGEWNRGEALFHYPKAGNAYCYIYETLGELLTLATTAERTVPSARTLQTHSGRTSRNCF